MKIKNPMLVVTDIDKSVEFYKNVFGLHVIMGFGANKTLTGGLALQTLETWQEFIGTDDISFGSNSSEVYFEEDNFDKFTDRLKKYNVEYVHPIKEHSWGQRVVRIPYADVCPENQSENQSTGLDGADSMDLQEACPIGSLPQDILICLSKLSSVLPALIISSFSTHTNLHT